MENPIVASDAVSCLMCEPGNLVKSKRILVVEDGAAAQDLQLCLRKLGYDVPVTVPTGAAAIEAAREHDPDLILIDVQLKGDMDGIEASGHIRDQFRTPVIFLTANTADDGTLERAKMTEPFGFIFKPFNGRELHTAIQVALHRHQGEVALRKSERWFVGTLRGIRDAIIAVNTDLRILFMNDVAASLTQWSEKDVVGQHLSKIYQLVDPKTGEILNGLTRTDFQAAAGAGEQTLGREAVLISRGGARIPVEDNSAPTLDDAGRVAGGVLVFRDISQRQQAEESHRANEEQIRSLANTISQLAWMAEPDGHIFWYNDRWYEYTGRTPDEMCGWGWRAVHDPAILPEVERRWEESLKNGIPFDMEFPLRGAGGEYRWFLTRVIPLKKAGGKVTCWIGTNTDIHEAREVREQLKRANTHLAQFAYSASHDLREPLRNVAVYSQLLGRRYSQVLDAQGAEFLGYITEGATRMETLVDDLLAYAESGTTTSAPLERVDATAVLTDVLAGLKASIDVSGAEITYGELPAFATRAVHLRQLLENLIGNAIKYRAGTPKIQVSAEAAGSEWIFAVSDNGIGIEPEYRDTVFGLFKRLNNPKEYSGTGLGLALCQNIVKLYNGRIWVDSKLGEGATFYFALPR